MGSHVAPRFELRNSPDDYDLFVPHLGQTEFQNPFRCRHFGQIQGVAKVRVLIRGSSFFITIVIPRAMTPRISPMMSQIHGSFPFIAATTVAAIAHTHQMMMNSVGGIVPYISKKKFDICRE